jgi:tetratricopeptide (TPR) repeat protein
MPTHMPSVALAVSVFGLAFIVRLVYVLQYRSDPLFDFPVIDSATYDRMAWRHAGGQPLWDDTFWQPPLYPWLLSLLYRLIGHSLLGARIVQAALGSLSCLLLMSIGTRVFGRTAGIAAAIAMAVYGTLIYFDGEILIPALFVFLLLASLRLLIAAGDEARNVAANAGDGMAGGPKSRRRSLQSRCRSLLWIAAGLSLGLACIARPTALFFVPLAALWIYLITAESRLSSRLRQVALLLMGVAVAIAPVTVRNYRVADELVLISANGGLNFYLGNNPDAAATVAIRPGFHWETLISEPRTRAGITSAAGRSRYFYAKGFDFLAGEPSAALSLYGQKLARLWNAFEIGRNRDVYATRTHSSLLSALLWRAGRLGVPFGLVAPLAATGMLFCFRRRDPARLLLYLFVTAHALAVVIFFVSSRYRLPMVPVLILFAAAAVVWLVDRARRRDLRALLAALVVVAVGFATSNAGYDALDLIYRGEEERYHGVMHQSRGGLPAAERAYRRAIEQSPDYAEAHAELAQLLQQQSRHQQALPHFRRAHALAPRSEKTHYLLGTGFLAVGDTTRAEALFRDAVRMAPPFALAHRDLGILHLDRGELEAAERSLLEAARLEPDDLDTWYKLGQCYFLEGRYGEAERALREALRLAPGDREISDKIESLRILSGRTR